MSDKANITKEEIRDWWTQARDGEASKWDIAAFHDAMNEDFQHIRQFGAFSETRQFCFWIMCDPDASDIDHLREIEMFLPHIIPIQDDALEKPFRFIGVLDNLPQPHDHSSFPPAPLLALFVYENGINLMNIGLWESGADDRVLEQTFDTMAEAISYLKQHHPKHASTTVDQR